MPDRIAPTAFLLAVFAALVTHGCAKAPQDERAHQLAARVRTEFLHAWNNYERYAWGHDALRPLSKTPHDWYGQSLLMTPVDALDTLILMKLDAEAAKAKALIVHDLSFDRDTYVKNFEITIRLLGGLLSSYQLTGDKRLLQLAEDLGNRLLPVFNSPTGLPYVYVNLQTGQGRAPAANCGTGMPTCKQASARRRLTARSMLSFPASSPSQAIWSGRVACKPHRSGCGTCTESNLKFSITKRCVWSPAPITCAQKLW